MPKLSKIRLVGCKYDSMKKEHENSIFDLNKDGNPSHTLFTLFNGGGKGFMMQMIFQLLIPETKWGKSSGNKILSMFYDSRKEFNTFTFHVVLEWVLDTNPTKKLINGIVVRSVIKNTSSEDDERTGLDYFLYTHEYEKSTYFTVENLPIYDKKTGESVDFDEFEKFIDSNKRDFIKYSKTSVSRNDSEYFNYLRSNGIYQSEWKNLREINRLEGGVGAYFSSARGNKSIFDKVIIPAISENIKNYSYEKNDSLIEMFKSNLSITKDLPVLLKREGDYKNLLLNVKPLINNADAGARFLKLREKIVDEGNNIFFILKEEDSDNEQEIKKWEDSLQHGENEKEELFYEKENLLYNKDKISFGEIKEKIEEYKNVIKNKNEIIDKEEENLLLYEINELIYKKNQKEKELKFKIDEKNNIMDSLRNSKETERLENLVADFEGKWNKATNNWANLSNEYFAYINYINELLERNKNDIEIYTMEIGKLNEQIFKFQLKEEALDKKREKLNEYYDPFSLLYPERILEEAVLKESELEKNIDKLYVEIKEIDKRILEQKTERIRHEETLKTSKKICEDLENKIKLKEKEEKAIAKDVCRELFLNYDGSFLDENWFNEKLLAIEKKEEEVKFKLEEVQKELWENNIDKVLNSGEYLIPNKDIAFIKNEISKLGIYSETGTEYLNSISEDERKHILDDIPEFIYSLVIKDDKDWEAILNNIRDDIFINNLVPIYIRSEMKKTTKNSYHSLKGKEYDLINSDNYFVWKKNLGANIEGLISTISNIKKNLKEIEALKITLKRILESDLSNILILKLKEEIDRKNKILDKIAAVDERKYEFEKKMNLMDEDLKLLKKSFDNHGKLMKLIEEYCDFSKDVENERNSFNQSINEKNEFSIKISNIKDDSDNLKINKNTVFDDYQSWTIDIKSINKEISRVIPEFSYKPVIDKTYSSSKTPKFYLDDDELLLSLREIEILNLSIREKDSKIVEIETALTYIYKDIDNIEKQLDDKKPNWNEYEYLKLPLNELKFKVENTKKSIIKYNTELTDDNRNLNTFIGESKALGVQLKNKEDQIEKQYKKSVKDVLCDDIDLTVYEVEKNIKTNKIFIDACKEELETHRKLKIRFEVNLNKFKNLEDLNFIKGKMDKFLKESIKNNPDYAVDQWMRKFDNVRRQIKETTYEGERVKSKFIKQINGSIEENKLKSKIMENVRDINVYNFNNNLCAFKSMELHFQNELQQLRRDKETAEKAMKQWTKRASIYVLRMIDALNSMMGSMNYINEQGYSFPLVKLKGGERLPKKEEEIDFLLEEHFVSAISQILDEEYDLNNLEDRILKKFVGDGAIFSTALKGRYPVLMVYKMSEKNEFKYARARDEYYDTWEAVNKGEGNLAEGSGGQTLSVNTFVIMMIMSFKKKRAGSENPSTVLIMDNPFGTASARHMLDPIFEIADKLNFQLICFSAPEIIKVEISERFPAFWELKVEGGKVCYGGRVIHAS